MSDQTETAALLAELDGLCADAKAGSSTFDTYGWLDKILRVNEKIQDAYPLLAARLREAEAEHAELLAARAVCELLRRRVNDSIEKWGSESLALTHDYYLGDDEVFALNAWKKARGEE